MPFMQAASLSGFWHLMLLHQVYMASEALKVHECTQKERTQLW